MQIVRTFRALRAAPAIKAERDAYGPDWSGNGRQSPADVQLQSFNRLWKGYIQRVPLYRDLRAAGEVPDRFESLYHMTQVLPVVEKADVRDRRDQLTDPIRPSDRYRVTGGSTGEPTRMPAWISEYRTTLTDKWIGRSFYGVGPADRLFTIWGHSHLLGKGVRGKLNAYLRQLKDQLIGTYRFSAYDLSPQASRRAGDIILAIRPTYVIAYSSALEFFARVNQDRPGVFAQAGVELALATGEIFPSPDGPDLVRRVLGCPLALEYGSVETDILAHTFPDLTSPAATNLPGYRVFWRRYFLECEKPNESGEGAVLVTSLYPRCFPLIRYRIGDFATLYPGDSPLSLTRVSAVTGRSNAFVQLSDGTRVHTMGIKHCVEGLQAVSRFQVVQHARSGNSHSAGIAELRVILVGPGSPEQSGSAAERARLESERAIREKATKIHPELGRMTIVFDRPLMQTQAGKIPMIAYPAGGSENPTAESSV